MEPLHLLNSGIIHEITVYVDKRLKEFFFYVCKSKVYFNFFLSGFRFCFSSVYDAGIFWFDQTLGIYISKKRKESAYISKKKKSAYISKKKVHIYLKINK